MSKQNRIQVHPIPAFRDNCIRAHIAYYGAKMVFCGDALFACGCGRVFEGTPPQLHASLAKLAALPDGTLVYCGHEYTLANIRPAANPPALLQIESAIFKV